MSSRFPPSSPASANATSEADEARELAEYFRQFDPVDVAAADWHTRWEQGLTVGEQAELAQWLAASDAHAAAYARLVKTAAELRDVPAEKLAHVRGPLVQPLEADSRSREPQRASPSAANQRSKASKRSSRASWSLGGFAARGAMLAFGCAVLLAIGLGLHHWWQLPVFEGSYVSERGQHQTIKLPDGTELNLDADTQTRVALYRDRREVRILEGQVMFTVAHDARQPFHVLAGPARVAVVGTRFSVRYRQAGMDAGMVKVAVEEGHVRVTGQQATDAVDLIAGQRLTVSSAGLVGDVAAVAPGGVALWRKGMVRFENTSLADALLEMERYGASGLVIRDPAVAAMTIGGSYQVGRPADFARMVARILPVRLVAGAGGQTEIVRAQ
ncbi:DUF4880 domain-containing protein [Pigmentiphaga aceris]|uniref:DUF4880 domain-containing protein n=1 Tax=Pigmentiphaga aceris TaxID=1940612 RepID=A0A5C0AZP3_9BURK|nr:FecR domain-containing protein [Pigmentiphaga aceris]QEI06893.1 DUF4880 domain-containing protein [Pigmentiphaga aceris]